jgi:hypothetical protein
MGRAKIVKKISVGIVSFYILKVLRLIEAVFTGEIGGISSEIFQGWRKRWAVFDFINESSETLANGERCDCPHKSAGKSTKIQTVLIWGLGLFSSDH